MIKPRDLLAAMAFQLGMWRGTDDERFGQCVECGATWMYGPGTGHRVNRRYCSMKCQEAALLSSQERKTRGLLETGLSAKKTAARGGRRSGSGGD